MGLVNKSILAWIQLREHGDMLEIQKLHGIHFSTVRSIMKTGRGKPDNIFKINEYYKVKAALKIKELDKTKRNYKKLIDDLN